MPVPDRYRSSFSPSTLQTIETHASRFRVTDPLFFRAAFTADVTENERRTFRPLLMVSGEHFTLARCGCQASMKPDDLCRHLAILVAHMAGEHEHLPSDRFEQSIWRAIAFASFSEGRRIAESGSADPREQLLRKYTLTQQEQQLLARCAGSSRLQFESSAWYRWAKEMFLSGGEATIRILDSEVTLHCAESAIAVPPAAVEVIINAAPEVIKRGGFAIAPQALTPSLRIEITPARALRFSPVLVAGDGTVYDRALLPQFGRYFLIGDAFASAVRRFDAADVRRA